jgi:hypothetical protein
MIDELLQNTEIAFFNLIRKFTQRNISQREMFNLMLQVNFFTELEKAGLSNVIEEMNNQYAGIVSVLLKESRKAGITVSNITLSDLEVLKTLDAERILRSAQDYALQFKSSLIKGLISGEDTNGIIAKLGEIPLRTNQLIAAVDTARDEFRAASTAKIFEGTDKRFVLAGPLDNKTRCVCRGVLEFQPKQGHTLEEIKKGAWTKYAKKGCELYAKNPSERKYLEETLGGVYTFVYRAKYGCRHYAEIV